MKHEHYSLKITNKFTNIAVVSQLNFFVNYMKILKNINIFVELIIITINFKIMKHTFKL